ncbi:MAG: fibronectin-binding domain-containing protein, partial [Clostridiales bacterium]|nr:fibronectin-binding domain-containing protein [Clostridiales bacterium]
ETTDELGERTTRRLILEAMGRRSNLILLDEEGRILDCLRRVDAELSAKRQLLPGMFYRYPEPHTGVPPLLAREMEFRGMSDPAAGLSQWAAEVSRGSYTPTMLLRDGRPVDFSFLPILQYGPDVTLRTCPDFSQLMDDYYGTRERQERSRQRGHDLVKRVTSARDRTARKLANQEQELLGTRDRERLRQLGDIVTSNLHAMEKGMTVLRAADFYAPEGGWTDIKLDPLLTPQQNAAKYYKQYTKAKTAEEMLTLQLERGRRELDYLNSVLESIVLAEGERDLQEIRQELTETGYLRRGAKAGGREKRVAGKPHEFRTSSGLRVLVGRNNSQNDLLTTRLAGKRDIWLHTQKIHGAHVILCTDGGEPDVRSLTEAAQIAACHSQAREGKQVPVDYTPVKFVKKPAGSRPGMVLYTTYQTAYVDPDEALVKALRVK